MMVRDDQLQAEFPGPAGFGDAGYPAVDGDHEARPLCGERFEGLIPPVVAAPTFAIRKPAIAVFTLDQYVSGKIMTRAQAKSLREAVARRMNILVAGGTSTFEPRMNIFGATAVTVDAEVPEPGSLALLAIGVLGLAGYRRRKA